MATRRKARKHAVEPGSGRIGDIDLPREKSVLTAYLLWLFLGFIGIHRYYLGTYLVAVLYTVTLAFVGVGWLLDVFLIPSAARKVNRRIWEQWFADQSDDWVEVEGTVRDVKPDVVQAGSYPGGQIAKQVLGFRVEELEEDGNIVRRWPVEMIGTMITGDLRDGDSIRLRGKQSAENIVRALEVYNLTTSSKVRVQF